MKNRLTPILFVVIFLFQIPLISSGQNKKHFSEKGMNLPMETLGDPYQPNKYNNKKVSPAYKYKKTSIAKLTGSTIFTSQVNVDENGNNILGDAANEPNIAVNPLNRNLIVIGWRQFDNILSNFRQAGWGYTTDGGQSWVFPGVLDSGIFRSDPVLDYDADGNFYYNSLTIDPDTNYLCKVFKSTSGGDLWESGIDAGGGDKQWMAIDRSTGSGRGNIYADWSQYSSSCAPGFFTRSSNGGSSFDSCSEINCNPDLGSIAVGNAGELYIAGRDFATGTGLLVTKSFNAQMPASLISWNSPVSVFMDGYINFGFINPNGLLGQAYIDVDRSNGSGQDNVYVLASLTRVSNLDLCDVMFAKSSDGGLSWGAPMRINDDTSNTNTQWFGTMSVAPNGRIDVVWLDTRDAQFGSDSSALYYSYSNNQGNTWSTNEKLSESFDPHVGYPNQNKMGDYIDMISDDSGADLAWTNTLNGGQDVYYSRIIPGLATVINENFTNTSFSFFPNPSNGNIKIRNEASQYTVSIFNAIGEKVFSFSSDQILCEIDITSQPSGIYFLKIIQQDGRVRVKKLIKE